MASSSFGVCNYCGQQFSKMSIKKHLDKCDKRKKAGSEERQGYFCISVQGYHEKEYWLYISVSANTTLKSIDKFLRDIWLECCGHLSSFSINGVNYDSSLEDSFGSKSMNVKVDKLFYEGLEFMHEYDFGTPTTLKLKVISVYTDAKRRNGVELMARNVQPKIKCSYCEDDATQVCAQCIYDDEGWVCDSCVENHECEEDVLLPVVNSPRVGVCGYCG